MDQSNDIGYRNLNDKEIGQLICQGCSSSDWNLVKVPSDFTQANIEKSKFTGNVLLNNFTGTIELIGGVKFNSGIYNAWLHNCEIGKNALINNVRGYIANYRIEEEAVIHNITTLAVDGKTSFGNGVLVEAINESGGRNIPIYDYLSAHIAYMMALYRHRPKLIKTLKKLVQDYTYSVTSDYGVIGAHSKILNCDTILNVKVGSATNIHGVKKLKNGTINSNYEAPVHIGEGVIMNDFIVSSGTRITDATLISKCFVGQGCRLTNTILPKILCFLRTVRDIMARLVPFSRDLLLLLMIICR